MEEELDEKQNQYDKLSEGQTLGTGSDDAAIKCTPNGHNCPKKRLKLTATSCSHKLSPMMVDLVLEKIFVYSPSTAMLKDLRLVSKAWNQQAGKMVRNKTTIDVENLILPYPEGLGWTEIDGGYQYQGSADFATFESVKVTATCDNVKDPKFARWFEVMGSSVKHLYFHATLSCYHHTRFLECILKVWCKNLKSLCLEGVATYASFYHYSRFDESNFICDLKDLSVSGDEEMEIGGDCDKELSKTYMNFQPDRQRQEPAGGFENIWLRALLAVGSQFNSQGADKLLTKLDTNYKTDGGIFGQMMQKMLVERLTIKRFPVEHCDAVVLTMNRRPAVGVQNLKEFTFGNFPLLLWEWQLSVIKRFNFPLVKLSLGPLSRTVSASAVKAFIESFAATLEQLELDGAISEGWLEGEDDGDEEGDFLNLFLPCLPKLKSFKNGNIFCTRVHGLDVLRKLPILEKCVLTSPIYHSRIYPLDPTQVFNLLFQAANFDNQTHPLKELRIMGGNVSYTRHVELLQQWFPQLTTIEITVSGTDVFVEFLRLMKSLPLLEDIKLSLYVDDHEWCNSALSLHLSFMTKLKYLELIHLPLHPLSLSAATCTVFSKVPKLTSLKLENFALNIDEVLRIRESLSMIGSVSFPRCVFQYSPRDVDLSSHCFLPLPFESTSK